MKFKIRISALTFGIITAACAVLAQVKFSFQPPPAYGVCMVCHARDLINTLLNRLDPVWWDQAVVSSVALKGLVLTTVGVLFGAFLAAVISGEFKLRVVENIPKAAICGFFVITAGLIISGCPMRLLLRTAYGDTGAALSVVTLILGIFLGTLYLKWEAKRKARRKQKKVASSDVTVAAIKSEEVTP